MNHIEPDDLATLALDGIEPEGVTRSHLDECEACRAEYRALLRTVELGRHEPVDRDETPPPSVWRAIHEELGLAPGLADDPLASRSTEAEPLEGDRRLQPHPVVVAMAPEPSAGTGDPASAEMRARRRWWPIALAAAAAGVVAGIALGAALAGLGPRPEQSPTIVASASLDAFPGWSTSGTALVEEDGDGGRSIVVTLDDDVPSADVREVWLIRSDASGLVSLGLLEGVEGRFAVPSGIDLDEYTLVDVSAEPVDGDPTHSGDSIVRGELHQV
ncbi:anti-sigma factor domain-containing protein [Agromyces sp. MMS24-JH15]|uniref:anti-sigma factor n=1 Tax=Agromyces sp. MMS24-JH15 TaxID=3243765 RepID=UPI00374A3013